MKETIERIRRLLFEAAERNPYKGVLFSGGLDSSIVAAIRPKIKAITVIFEGKAPDVRYSRIASAYLGAEHLQRSVDADEAIAAIPKVIKTLRSFDPAIPNDLAVYFGFKFAKELGIDTIATGDAGDELFCGYSFMRNMHDLEDYIKRITRRMSFSSNEIANAFSLKIVQPFIDRKIVEFALKISAGLKIRKDKGRIWGKWILRKAFEGFLPKETLWQTKRPLEKGSGMTRMRSIISGMVSDREFEKRPPEIKFISKEHFYYYKVYKKVVGEIPAVAEHEKSCPSCGGGMKMDAFHCKICGSVLDWRI